MKLQTLPLAFFILAAVCLRLPAEPSIVTDQPQIDGIEAIVDQDVITDIDVEQQFAETRKLLRLNFHGEELATMIRKTRLKIVNTLIDRLLILHEFARMGGRIPSVFVDARVKDEIDQRYAGDAKLFAEALADRGETMEEFKKEIANNSTVQYMHTKFVTSKVDALAKTNPTANEAGEITQQVQKQWLDSLRAKSYVKVFPTGT
jgi:hypothetical protein